MAPKQAIPARTAVNPFTKPAAKTGGNFKFKLPDQMDNNGRGRIPKGKYLGRLTEIGDDPSKTSGNPMWTWTFVVTKGPHAGRDFKLYTVLTDDAAWKVVETLDALGQHFEPGEEININKKELIGTGATLVIKDDNGKDGDGEFSKLDKILAHPNGAGYKSKSGPAAQATMLDDIADEEDEEVDNIEALHESEGEEEDEQFSCPECDFVGTGDEVDLHMQSEHSEEPEEEEPEPEPAPPPRRAVAKKAAPPAAKKTAAKKTPTRGAPATIGRKR